MKRSGTSPSALAEMFAADAETAVIFVLREAGTALTAAEVKKLLLAGGVAKTDADRGWPTVQKRLRQHDQVIMDGQRYRWSDSLSALDALELLTHDGLAASSRAVLAETIRAAIAADTAPATEQGPEPQPESDLEAEARQRQSAIDAVRRLAELASEVEELLVNETTPEAMIRQVRAWVGRSGLEPVGRAGEEVRFNRKLHSPIGGRIGDGAPVVVVRPGYVWKAQDEDVLIGKAIVEE